MSRLVGTFPRAIAAPPVVTIRDRVACLVAAPVVYGRQIDLDGVRGSEHGTLEVMGHETATWGPRVRLGKMSISGPYPAVVVTRSFPGSVISS